jgi:hypothetical protein
MLEVNSSNRLDPLAGLPGLLETDLTVSNQQERQARFAKACQACQRRKKRCDGNGQTTCSRYFGVFPLIFIGLGESCQFGMGKLTLCYFVGTPS